MELRCLASKNPCVFTGQHHDCWDDGCYLHKGEQSVARSSSSSNIVGPTLGQSHSIKVSLNPSANGPLQIDSSAASSDFRYASTALDRLDAMNDEDMDDDDESLTAPNEYDDEEDE